MKEAHFPNKTDYIFKLFSSKSTGLTLLKKSTLLFTTLFKINRSFQIDIHQEGKKR